jgi:predicted RNA-binding Zn ribbon-like protein
MGTISDAFASLGEPLAVELVNTRPMRDGHRHELLADESAAAAWLRAHATALPAGAMDTPPPAGELRALRGAVEALFHAALASVAPAPAAVAAVNEASAAAPLRFELEWDGTGFGAAVVAGGSPGAAASLAAIARSAIEVLGDPRGARLRKCEAPGCVLVFVASNPRRRWCSATSCGNRVRVARHYQRSRAVPSAG